MREDINTQTEAATTLVQILAAALLTEDYYARCRPPH
jgi:hypothetical protein